MLPAAPAGLTKSRDVIVYSDERYYSAFPSIVRRPDGELLAAFRRAPDRRALGQNGNLHTHPNSYLVLVRSRDNGLTWSKDPELIFAHPLGGSQDPGLLQLSDGTLLCTSYLWTFLDPQSPAKSPASAILGNYAFQGGYYLRSTDGARTWKGPFVPPPIPGRDWRDGYGQPLPSYNRGALCQGRDGRIFWAVASRVPGTESRSDVHLLISSDRGVSWKYSCVIAADAKATFNETALYETPKGDLVAFLRTANLEDHTVVARSRDGGRTFEPWQDGGWQGHPHHAVRLPDNRVFLVYGYRHQPFGIRARMLDAECKDFATAPETILRDDGGSGDLGYPWAVALPNRQILAVYYFQKEGGTRHIAGTLLAY
ncbi:MAG: exo-alpha-sialidase [Acidobacteria bacterium]|nr:exo-alpha-sialidase [Acidobacteriota bacterium]